MIRQTGMGIAFGFLILAIAGISLIQAANPPIPHGVTGYVYYPGGTQVPSGTHIQIINQNLGETKYGVTGTPVPGSSGFFSYVINGSIGDSIKARAWNITHYAEVNATLAYDFDVALFLNRTRPAEINISIVAPDDNSLLNVSDAIILNVSINVLGGIPAQDCNFSVEFDSHVLKLAPGETSVHNFASLAYGILFYETWNISPKWIGSSDITVVAECNSDFIMLDNLTRRTISNITIQDKIPPNVTLLFPQNASYKNSTSIEFAYYVWDHINLSNCTIGINNGFTDTDLFVENQQNNTFVATLSQGVYSWNVTCYDLSSNRGFSGNSILTVDTTNPLVRDIAPPANADFNYSDKVSIRANVSDNYIVSGVWVNITWNGSTASYQMQENGVDANGNGEYEHNFSSTTFPGNYNFSVWALDDAKNRNSTHKSFFTIYGIDFQINASSLIFPSSAVEFSVVELTTRVFKTGNLNATNVVVGFYEGGYPSGELVGSTSFNITNQDFADVAVKWTAKIGTWEIEAVVDPPLAINGSIREMDELNNHFRKNITVRAYHVFYGNASFDVVLDTSSNFTIESWAGRQGFTGNVYAVDEDSRIDWGTLLSLSRNTGGGYEALAFEVLDARLGMTELNDSINRTYTCNGNPCYTRDFAVFDTILENVPVVNSTDSSAFVTGLLWDYGDGGSSYDGSQDVAFVANLNYSSPGLYGIYDYELRVPARLREYITPNLANTITLYVEIT